MATNLDLDDELVEAAQKLGRHKTKREAVNRALSNTCAGSGSRRFSSQFGTIQYDPKYDYKKQRNVA